MKLCAKCKVPIVEYITGSLQVDGVVFCGDCGENIRHDRDLAEAERNMLLWAVRLDKLMGRETSQVDVLKRALAEALDRWRDYAVERPDRQAACDRIAELRKLAG